MTNNTVLVVNPHDSQSSSFHVSPIYLQLKSHYLCYGAHASEWNWPYPITYVDDMSLDGLVAEICFQKPTVLALSVQMWNFALVMSIGRAVKSQLPTTRIIVGGPDSRHKYNMSWFKQYDFVDAICSPDGYGEDFMTAYLDAVSEGTVDFTTIPNAVYPSGGRTMWHRSSLYTDKREFKYPSSVFYGSDEYVKTMKILATHHKRVFTINYETTRGCPYACTFCDWPGGLKSRIVRKPPEVMDQELIDLGKYGFNEVSLCDANFGALGKRDLDIMERLVRLATIGELQAVTNHGRAKHNIDIVEQLDTMLLEAGLYASDDYIISVNGTDPDVLKAIERINQPMDKIVSLAKRIREKYGKFITLELIIGLPLYTLDKFYDEFDVLDATEGWLSERNPWVLLSESAGATPEYRAKYNIQTVRVGYFSGNNFGKQVKSTYTDKDVSDSSMFSNTYDIVVGTSTYTPTEWCEMYTVDHMARAFELSHFVRPIRAHQQLLGVSTGEFYRRLWRELQATTEFREVIADITTQVAEIVAGDRQQFEWFTNIWHPTTLIKLETYFNLLVVTYPSAFYDAVIRSCDNPYEARIVADAIEVTVGNTPVDNLNIASQVLVKKVK